MQPTHDSLHLGNYLGALVQWVGLQETHDAFYCVVDLHAITVEVGAGGAARADPASPPRSTSPAGSTPSGPRSSCRATSPQHAELAWVLGVHHRLRRGRPDDAVQGQVRAERRRGHHRRPVHLPGPHGGRHPALRRRPVPVGEDQRQHLELTRDLAAAVQQPLRRDASSCPSRTSSRRRAKIHDLQDPTAKMSKSSASRAGVIDLLDDPKVHRQEDPLGRHRHRARDPLRPRRTSPACPTCCRIHSRAVRHARRRPRGATTTGKGYGDLKKDVAEVVVEARHAVPRPHPRADGRPRPSSTGSSPTAPSRARAVAEATLAPRLRQRRLPAAPGAEAVRPTVRDDRRRRSDRCTRDSVSRRSEPYGSASSAARRSATRWPTRSPRTSPCCRRPRSPHADLADVERALRARWPRRARRSPSCCAAPARSGRSRRSCFVQVARGVAECERLERRCDPGPLAP